MDGLIGKREDVFKNFVEWKNLSDLGHYIKKNALAIFRNAKSKTRLSHSFKMSKI